MRPAATIVLVFVLALGVAACSRPQPLDKPSTVSEATRPVGFTADAAAAPAGSSPAAASPPSSRGVASQAASPAVADGVYDCYVTAVDRRGGGRVTVVFARVFTGAEAEQAAAQADEQLPPGIGHYVRVDDPATHAFAVAKGVTVPEASESALYRLTLRDGRVVALEAEHLP